MKKIIYSVVCALIINGVLALVFPTWFLKGDACRTYLSDAARVDIALIGNVRNSRVTAEGADVRTSQPAWFSGKTYQGTVVEVPISYRSKSYKIKIIPRAAECGENASLDLTFRGADIKENGKRRPAWVTFQNISLNGQRLAQRQKVWHDKPFILKHPPHVSEVVLSFDVHKPFKASDLSFTHIALTFTVFLLFSLFLFSQLKKDAAHALIFTDKKELVREVSDDHRDIVHCMQKAEIQQNKAKRIYFIEFLRIFLILSVFLLHVGGAIDTGMKKDILEFFGTSKWNLDFAVQPFFIIGGFFLYGKLAKDETVNVFSSIGKLWMRLMPGIIFCFTVLAMLGAKDVWALPFCFLPLSGYGLSGSGPSYEVVGLSDWFVSVYFATSCLFIALFATLRRGAWIPVCMLMFICWCTLMTIGPKSALRVGGMYYGILAPRLAIGICCMGLGMVAGYLSAQWAPRVGMFLRLVATAVEALTLFMLFNFMYRISLVHYHLIAVHLATAALLISAAHGWGYISAFLNRLSGVMYVSRYTYSLLLIQGMLVTYFDFNHNFGINAHVCSLIILCTSVPLILIEYHIIEKWLTPAIKRVLTPDMSKPIPE